ncbi:MAG: hypothetical protein JWQ34_632 [Mucilaginibacter sp.]|uniref:hypothetical protein n=1 Tax=Mucilaginibacter sp. TaxID=1882438 RepID=UPI0026086579|nr:hypothetical protein [Mucilaginibacter sp.]MDB5002407.1 hypothetical protein [Mucilaginibacter sp.]
MQPSPRKAVAVYLIISFIAFLTSCKPDNIQTAPKYFDIKGYFHADSLRLTKLNHLTLKTVRHNGVSETKKVHINNWGSELSLFINSDINKPAWRDSYNIQDSGDALIYRAKTFDLKTQLIIITKNGDKIKWILIYNSTKNTLYHTTETLSYYPDSLYIIQKFQQISLFGDNRYTRKIGLLAPNNYTIKGSLN